ncbi:MAG: hypothetical protein ACE5JI_10480 [Acidobacteriota bacterium]
MGIPVSLCTDDRGMWDSNMTDEYFNAVKHFNLSWDEMTRTGLDSIEFSFADAPTKLRLVEEYRKDLAAFEARYQQRDWKTALGGVRPTISGYAKRSLGIEN